MDAAQQSGWAYREMKLSIGKRVSYFHRAGQFMEVLQVNDGTTRVINAAPMPGLQQPEDWKPFDLPAIPAAILEELKGPPIRVGRLAYALTKGMAATIRWSYQGSDLVGAMYWDGESLAEEIKVDSVILFSDWSIMKEWPC